MRKRDDLGQIKFWKVALIIGAVAIVAFDLLSPQLVKVQLADKANNLALDQSQLFVRNASAPYAQKYNTLCDNVTEQLKQYGAEIVPGKSQPDPSNPSVICPDVSIDGKVEFTAGKKAPCILLCRIGMKNYYDVKVDVSEKSGG